MSNEAQNWRPEIQASDKDRVNQFLWPISVRQKPDNREIKADYAQEGKKIDGRNYCRAKTYIRRRIESGNYHPKEEPKDSRNYGVKHQIKSIPVKGSNCNLLEFLPGPGGI